jgi:hypothetical protein
MFIATEKFKSHISQYAQFHIQGKVILREYSLAACEQSPGLLLPEPAASQALHAPSSLPVAWLPEHQFAPWITKHGVTLP